MTKYPMGGLSHHEELRYFYLLRNLSYLSENEKKEFAFLKSKLEIGRAYAPSKQHYRKSKRQEPYFEDDYYNDYSPNDLLEDDDVNHDSSFVPYGLPIYPKEDRYLNKKTKLTARRPIDAPQPIDEDDAFLTESVARCALPRSQKRKHKKKGCMKWFFNILGLLLMTVLMGLGLMFAKGVFDISTNKANYKPAVSQAFDGQETQDGTNILVLGSDQRVTQGSTDARTDTIMVVNVGNHAKKIKMVSFMRDTLINIPGYSYNDNSYDLKLNSAFNLGEQEDYHGAEYVRRALKHNFDIDIKYYVMVDFETFAEAIDTLFPNGVKIDAKFATVGGVAVDSVEVPDDLRMKNGVVPNQTIEVGEQRMDGRTLLNYARFRKDDEGDFGRTVRQQQVMSAVMSQIKDPTKLFTGSAAIGKIYALTSTNVSFPFVVKNGVSVLGSGKNGVEHVTIPENGDWVDEYDMYGGQALYIDFDKYQKTLAKLGLR
ncbi:LCP family protein [Streptococcus pyogenes]|uniref:LCP family protein n=1 Tax=Streptococcus pyogenes TaxID=1314 RepID=UPI00109C62D6|nr:LCP family protein [Streptococcus pyogenes]VGV10038.1 cell envelope-related function transcriptional attenuator common domain-containing protein [Streptococcus pyogenes]VGV16947.1 cell envelope-related function transcriptional attenuator common domain-containing protein [Streptococcus pyogenes]VGV44897.1 cell envelope-related function transcriptional attenuator common domain-containing protein [Streptococcus pyogenes]VGW29754.1 cell envelope-related function transcriptional attenuator common